MPSKNPMILSEESKTRDKNIEEVLTKLYFERQSNGKKYNISTACAEVGVSRSTWYSWRDAGHIDVIKAKIINRVRDESVSMVLPHVNEIMTALINLATGKPPRRGMKVTPAHMISAFKELKPLIGLDKPADNTDGEGASEFLENFRPKSLFVKEQNISFVYTGNSGVPKMGKMKSITNDDDDNDESIIDGDIVE